MNLMKSTRNEVHPEGTDDRSARQPTIVERLIVGGGAIVTVTGFLAVLGGVVAGATYSLYAWPVVGIAVLVACLGLEWFVGRAIPVSVGIKGIDSIGTLLLALCGVGMGTVFLWALGAALRGP